MQCPHRLFEWCMWIRAMRIKDVYILQTHTLEALIKTCQQIFTRSKIAIRAGPHIPSCLGRDDQLVTVRFEVLPEDATEIFFSRTERWTVIIGQVKMRDPVIKTCAQDVASVFQIISMTQVVPQAHRQCRQQDAAASATTILHVIVSAFIGHI